LSPHESRAQPSGRRPRALAVALPVLLLAASVGPAFVGAALLDGPVAQSGAPPPALGGASPLEAGPSGASRPILTDRTAPARAPPAPLAANGTPANWSPYAPAPFTHGRVALGDPDYVDVSGLPSVAVNQSGIATVAMNGTWRPTGLTPSVRDWVLLIVVRAGRAEPLPIFSNTTTSVAFSVPDLPASLILALPSSTAFVPSPPSDATVLVTPPGGAPSRLNLTGTNTSTGRLYLGPAHADAAAMATQSVWTNMSGTYPSGGVVSGNQNVSLLVPFDGQPPVTLRAGEVGHWTGAAAFPGGRFLKFTGGGPIAIGPPVYAAVWSRGSPESGLFVDASISPDDPVRGQNITVVGTAGDRSLLASTNWSAANTTASAPASFDATSCTAALRLQNGSFRLFCVAEDTPPLLSTEYTIISAISRDGLSWSWEPGTRWQLCNSHHIITELALVRLPSGGLRMYYGGNSDSLDLTCSASSTVHVSSITSNDEGVTWSLESEALSIAGVTQPDVRAVVPLADGRLRMYLDSNSGLASALSEDGVAWTREASISASMPRAVHALTNGGFKMYFGTGSIQSRLSADGITWTAAATERTHVAAYETGPLIDRGDGDLAMVLFSESTGIHSIELARTASGGTALSAAGTDSTGAAFGADAGNAGAAGGFSLALSVPDAAPLGRVTVAVRAWFGGPDLAGVVLNRPPVWSGPAALAATEDVDLVVDLSAFASDPDVADTLSYEANTPYGVLNGSALTLNYPHPVTSDTLTGRVLDGHDATPFSVAVLVTLVNDPPVLTLNASYPAVEDSPSPVDFTPALFDEETPVVSLNLSTDAPGATVAGQTVTFNYATDGPRAVNITLSDGTSSVSGQTTIVVAAVDDAPVLTLAPGYNATQGVEVVLDLTAAITDEDTGAAGLSLSTNLSGATVVGLTIRVTPSAAGLVPFNVTATDGTTAVVATSVLVVSLPNQPPVWTSAPDIVDVLEDVPRIVDLAPFVSDPDNATSTLVFTSSSPYATINGSQMTLLYGEGEGVAGDQMTLTVSDGEFAVSIEIVVDVDKVNDPPTLVGTPPTSSNGTAPVTYQFGASDPDDAAGFTFTLVTGPSWVTVSASGLLTIAPPAGEHGRVQYSVRVTDPEGDASATVTYEFVLPANRLPVMEPNFTALPAAASPGVPFSLTFNVTDADGDPVTAAAAWTDGAQRVTLTAIGGGAWRFDWMPNYTFNPTEDFWAWFNGSVTFDDSFGTVTYPFAIVAAVPPPARPTLAAFPKLVGPEDTQVTVYLWGNVSDPDPFDTAESLEWAFDLSFGAGAYEYDHATGQLTIFFTGVGNGNLKVTVTDSAHLSAERVILLEGTAAGVVPGGGDAFPPWWLWLLLIAGAAVGGAIGWRRMHRPALPVAEPLARPPPAAAAAEPVLAPAAPPKRRAFLVEDVFLLYHDGRLIFNRTGLGADAVDDPESVGSMLVAVQDFVRDSFRKGSPVDRMGYGDSVILIERGASVILAITVFGEPDAEYRDMMREAARKVEMTYAGVIEQWDGSRTELAGVEPILAPLWELTADLTRGDVLLATTAKEVQMLSGVEFFQGYVRLKVGIVNNTRTVITNVTVDIDYSADVLRLQKIEPSTYKTAGTKVSLGVLQSGEKSTLAYYFDPQICTSSAIDGSCRYKDAEGSQHIVQMKSRQAEVVCPLFFTKEHANTAMLKRLVETELNQFDLRSYSFAEGLDDPQLERLFNLMKGAVLAHDVQLVRSFERRRPYKAEGWFYGKTQKKGYQMVIRVWVDAARRKAQFYTASTAMAPVTGLLAELHHTFSGGSAGDISGLGIEALFEEEARQEYEDPKGVSKMLEAESEAGETDAG